MATSNPNPSVGKDFVQKVEKTRKEIERHFRELVDSAKARESELLKSVDEILRDFREKVKEKDQMQIELDKTKESIRQNIQVQGLMDLQREILSKIEERVEKIKKEIDGWEISFSGDEEIIERVKKLGHVSTKFPHKLNSVDYKNKLQAVKSFGIGGSAPGQLNQPWGVAIDANTSNLFIADHMNNRVQVFSEEGTYLYKFGDGDSMNYPIGVDIFQDKVFVTQNSGHCLQVYNLDGTSFKTVGSQGSGDGQLQYPYGLEINRRNGDIYICDANNKRVQLFSQDLKFKSSLWANTLSRPLCIKLTDDSIVVLDQSPTCLHIYNYNHAIMRSLLTRGPGKQIQTSHFFCLDADNNIYITDNSTGRVHVFDIQGFSLHQFGNFTHPSGIALTRDGNIIICSSTKDHCIQIW